MNGNGKLSPLSSPLHKKQFGVLRQDSSDVVSFPISLFQFIFFR